jgi:lysozyme
MSAAIVTRKLTVLFSGIAILVGGGSLYVREGYKEKAYKDPVHGAAKPTVCMGVTEGVVLGRVYSPDECAHMQAQALFKNGAPIIDCMPDSITPAFDRYVSEQVDLAYNIGGPGAYKRSSMCRRFKAADYKGACDAILLYKYAGKVDCSRPGNRVCPGLWTRRLESHAACMKAIPEGAL